MIISERDLEGLCWRCFIFGGLGNSPDKFLDHLNFELEVLNKTIQGEDV